MISPENNPLTSSTLSQIHRGQSAPNSAKKTANSQTENFATAAMLLTPNTPMSDKRRKRKEYGSFF
jgi:hypothetical protein